MAMKKLSSKTQSLFSTSIHLFSYKRAVEELVYNAIDAKSTSIAIRIHIQENKIQVVDNGNGIAENDFKLLGERHATSKFVDMTTFQSAPDMYGFRGQAIASIVDISKSVKITSRHNDTAETWTKSFYRGKHQKILGTPVRPSKGTTVEINGFLYNLNIQNKSINYLNELNGIKTSLEQLSLVHNNVSFSLRDDSKNEIVFKVHKNRDIYQTFKSLLNIDKSDIQELQVEKGNYKAIAYIAKTSDHENTQHSIYLNKRFTSDSRLHKLIQKYLKKPSKQTRNNKRKFDMDEKIYDIAKSSMPFYFIFIACPYYDYGFSNTPKQSNLEFKNWNQINELLEKIMKFYKGDLKLKQIKKIDNGGMMNFQDDDNTRKQVKEIINKILGSHPKNPGVSQMQNGIRGKIIKRKKMKNKISLSKVLTLKDHKAEENLHLKTEKCIDQIQTKFAVAKSHRRTSNCQVEKKVISHRISKNEHQTKYHKLSQEIKNKNQFHERKLKKDVLIKAFENKTDTLVKRCNVLAKKVTDCIPYIKEKRIQNVFVNKTVNYNNIIRNNEKVSIRKQIQETIIHDYVPLRKSDTSRKKQHNINPLLRTSHDLIKTVIGSAETLNMSRNKSNNDTLLQKTSTKISETINYNFPQLTFESHHYARKNSANNISFNNQYTSENNLNILKKKHFLSKRSQENFLVPTEYLESINRSTPIFLIKDKHKITNINVKHCRSKNLKSIPKFDVHNVLETMSSHTIDFSQSKDIHGQNNFDTNFVINNTKSLEISHLNETTRFGFTYTLTATHLNNNNLLLNNENTLREEHCTHISSIPYNENKTTTNEVMTKHDSLNVIFVSNKNSLKDTSKDNLEPLSVCEAVLGISGNITSEDIIISNNNNNNESNDLHYYLNTSEYFSLNNQKAAPEQNLLQKNSLIAKSNNYFFSETTNVDHNFDNLHGLENVMQEANLEDDTNLDHVENLAEVDLKELANNYNLKNRPRFLPKGMSPIFRDKYHKNVGQSDLNRDYFHDELYNKFIHTVQTHSEIYQVHVQNPNDATTKAIDKANIKINKENSSLTFNTHSLQEANVLGQVDRKFIAAILKGSCSLSEYLVLFDQHAVHERIRLEDNLSDYYDGNTWKSVNLDNVVLKLSKEEILYLHNYKEKFTLFGLHWTVLQNDEIVLHALPKAILGNNPRQVDKIMSAVKNLISEEVDIIKAQKGVASVYPKSIMDLVFSEACRYAIMFGDSLTKNDCAELIHKLSSCNTPFQCAHGRPVMAVITGMTSETRHYQINKDKLHCLKVTG